MKKLFIFLFFVLLFFAGILYLQWSANTTEFIWSLSNQGAWLLPLIIVSALIDSVNPCAFSILLLTIAFLFSLERLRTNILLIGSFYIFGLFLTYLLIGLGILEILHLFNTPHFMAKLGATLMILFGGVNLINAAFPQFPLKLKIPGISHRPMAALMEKASLPAAFFLGALVGLCEFPCTGGPYLTILGLLHDSKTYLNGLFYLVFYNVIFIFPLVLILMLASNSVFFQKIQEWKHSNLRTLRLISGIAMVLLALFILYF